MDSPEPVLVVAAAVRRPVVAAALAAPAPSAQPLATTGKPRRVEWPGRLHVVQIVCWQVAGLAVVAALDRPRPVLLAVIAGAAVLLGLTAVRVAGRWGYELAGVGARFLVASPRRSGERTTADLLALLSPGSVTSTMATAEGPALTISDPAGLTAIVRPHSLPAGGVRTVAAPGVLLDAICAAGLHEVATRTVFHADGRPGAQPTVLVSVHAERTVDVSRDDELTQVLHNAVRRALRALQRAGIPTAPLPEQAARTALADLAHVAGDRCVVREDWRYLRTGPIWQACLAVHGWDRLLDSQAAGLVGHVLGRSAGVATTLTLIARSADGDVGARALIRLAATSANSVDRAAAGLVDLLTPLGIGLTRCDGGHLTGVAASLPIGGFLS